MVTQAIIEREIAKARKAEAEHSGKKAGPNRRIGFFVGSILLLFSPDLTLFFDNSQAIAQNGVSRTPPPAKRSDRARAGCP